MSYRAVLLDIDGVLTVSWRALPGAIDAVAALRAAGCRLRFVTNTTSRTRDVLSETLGAAGFEIPASEIMTATAATADYLRRTHAGKRCYVLTSGDVDTEFHGVELASQGEPADVVVMGGAGIEFSHDALNHAYRLLSKGAALVAMHRNLFWQTGDGLTMDAGAYIDALEHASGAQATVIGKPSRAFYEDVLAKLGVTANNAVMIGDDLVTDVQGAQGAGIAAVLVRTGKFRQDAFEQSMIKPDAVIDSIVALPAWLAGR